LARALLADAAARALKADAAAFKLLADAKNDRAVAFYQLPLATARKIFWQDSGSEREVYCPTNSQTMEIARSRM
jgi:hypothetical protein